MYPPSISRDVHYVAYGTPGGEYAAGAHRAAKITEVVEPYDPEYPGVSLVIFNPTGQFFLSGLNCFYDESGTKPGTWHYPEIVRAFPEVK